MPSSPQRKSTVDEIRARFDRDVERFSNLASGQSATMDAPLVLDLIARCAAGTNPAARSLLDVGCGAGNYTLKLLAAVPTIERVTLIDLSRPMLDRAAERIAAQSPRMRLEPIQADVREANLPDDAFDVAVAAAVLHHLRTDNEWRAVFAAFHRALRAGGSLWVADYIEHDLPSVQNVMWDRFGEYLTSLKGESYRDEVFAYVQAEDTPRSLTFQLELLRAAGFARMDILHKNAMFGAFGAIK